MAKFLLPLKNQVKDDQLTPLLLQIQHRLPKVNDCFQN